MNATDIFAELNEKETKRAQQFVNDCKKRIASLESVEYTEKSFKQIQFLKDCIEIIVFQSSRTDQLNATLITDYNWGIDKHTELAKEKLLNASLIRQLNSAQTSNTVLAKLMTKLDGKRIIKRPIYILHPKYINKINTL